MRGMRMDIKEHNEQAKAWLRRYADCVKDMQTIEMQYQELVEAQESTGAIRYSDMPKSSGNQKDLSDYMVIRENELHKYWKARYKKLKIGIEIKNAINALPTADERMLMTLRYINLMKWEDIAERMNISKRHATTNIHSKALSRIQIQSKRVP